MIRRSATYLLLFLYLYNFFGYLTAFSLLQHRVRQEVRRTLEQGIPESELVTIAVPGGSAGRTLVPLHWIEDREFRYGNELYDVVRSFSRGDTVFYLCINDTKEQGVLEGLEDHVRRNIDAPQQKTLFAFAEVFKDSLPTVALPLPPLARADAPVTVGSDEYESVIPEIPFPPPRPLPSRA